MNKIKVIISNMNLKSKLILLVVTLILFISICISGISVFIFSSKIKQKTDKYIDDITMQATNNLQNNINKIEEITFNILSNRDIQSSLRIANKSSITDLEKIEVNKNIRDILDIYGLFNNDIISLSVISNSNIEIYTKQNILEDTKKMFSKSEIYEANGSTLWRVTGDNENSMCVARAVIDLDTQKPIGYINLVCKEGYFKNIINDISSSYTSGTYVVSEDNLVMYSNNKEKLWKYFGNKDKENEGAFVYHSDIIEKTNYIYSGDQMTNKWTLITTIPKNELQKEINIFTMIIVCLNAVVILAAVVIILYLVNKIVHPINELCENMEYVGNGDFKKRTVINTNDEIGKLSISYNIMLDNIENLIEKVYKLEISQRQAELEFLKMQINPHFLYNTLDTILFMAYATDNNDIVDVTAALAELLRATIKQNSFITIEEELKTIKNYLLIQKYRFGEKINVDIRINEELNDIIIPNFLLQPLVENAIIHGFEPKISNGNLIINIDKMDEFVYFEVIDDGVGISKEMMEEIYKESNDSNLKSFIGLKNVYKRLKIYFGDKSSLKIESKVDEGTKIHFKIPLGDFKY